MRKVFLPTTVYDVRDILAEEPKAALYGGGTDLLVQLRAGKIDPSVLVCLERTAGLRGIEDAGDAVKIGAATTHATLLKDPIIREHFPVLAKAVSVLGSPPIRNMGTIGGNIVTASPAGDTLPALHVLDAEVEILSPQGVRRSPVRDFIRGPGVVALDKGDLVTAIWIRKTPSWGIHHYEKVGRRKALACAVASMAAVVAVSAGGLIERVRLAWGSVGPRVVTSLEVEAALVGKRLQPEDLGLVAGLVERCVEPIDDVRATAEYRRIVAGALVQRLSEYA